MKKVSFIFFIILLSLVISTFIWDHIILPYNDQNEIYGEYARLNYNPYNDTLRYLTFILIPLTAFLVNERQPSDKRRMDCKML